METKKNWHTNTEIPNGKDRYIIKWKDRNSYKLATDKEWVIFRLSKPSFAYEIERWAYIKDLETTCEQLQQKQVDWEQRRYEIAKDMLCAIYMDEGNEKRSTDPGIEFEYQSLEGSAREAVRYANVLIEELKKHDNG
jgi:hypothetical protein